jgi:disulfide bond formation protein DsbB
MKAKTSQNAKTEVCSQCLLIRYFVATAIAIVLLALIAGENTKFLGMFTPERASAAIVLGGALMASVKIWLWRREGRESEAKTD